jgi:hypothetical protein
LFGQGCDLQDLTPFQHSLFPSAAPGTPWWKKNWLPADHPGRRIVAE